MESKFLDLFRNKKPILGMIHLKGDTDEDIYERMKKEVQIYLDNGVDCIILENISKKLNVLISYTDHHYM